jgi:hypothetical protein
MSREAWKTAKAELDAIEAERAALVAPTDDRYHAAMQRLDDVETDCGTFIGHCECGEPIFEGDRYHRGSDVYLCEPCAPAYADMLAHPESFAGSDDDGQPMTADEAKAIVDAHVAGGGSVEDKMVSA